MSDRRESFSGSIEIGERFYPFLSGFDMISQTALQPVYPGAQFSSSGRDFEDIAKVRVELIERFHERGPFEGTIDVVMPVLIRPVILFDAEPKSLDYTLSMEVGGEIFSAKNFVKDPSLKRALFRDWADTSGIRREPRMTQPEDLVYLPVWID